MQATETDEIERACDRLREILKSCRDEKKTGWYGVTLLYRNGEPQIRKPVADGTEEI